MTELTDLSETDASNTTITGANIAENCNPSDINNAIRNLAGLIRRAFKASIFRLRDTSDQTKLLAFDLSGITTATTRTLTVPNESGTIVTTSAATSQAGMESESATGYVRASHVKYSPGVAKCWVHCGVAGNVYASYGVSSVTDNGVGDVTVNQSVTVGSNVGPVMASCYSNAARILTISAYTSTSFRALSFNADTDPADPGEWFLERLGTLS